MTRNCHNQNQGTALETKMRNNLRYKYTDLKKSTHDWNEQLFAKRWPLSYLNLNEYHQDTYIMITCQCNEHPFSPHLYIVKLGITRIHIFLSFAIKQRPWYSLEPPQWGGSNVYPRSMFRANIRKYHIFFSSKSFHFQPWNIAVYCTDMFA